MFFAPAARGLVSLESGDLMACEIVPVPCECWAIATPTSRKMFARTYDTLLKFRGQSRAQDRMIWIGTVGDAIVMCCKHIDSIANGLPLGIVGMI